MKLYNKPIKAYLPNDLTAVEEHDGELTYFFKKGYVTVLGEFECEKYVGGTACIILNQEEVISIGKEMLRFVDDE
ncbi:hypothetical protein [Bacillus sp. 7894-2]|uniref:hypothetical protein n=1 Tax=Bacillus sp. 7894-2 TaxID=2021695 RepID=UPI000BA53139|nr:hypothetical protein [Bacillus sp. 7894-2]PAE23189.1 hypothetical protein CHI10_19055 [Bacillus sp. 7894-2]